MRIFNWIIISSLVITFACAGNNSQVPADVVNIPNSATGDEGLENLPVMEFTTTEHDFGKMIQGEIVSYSFKFRNTGKSDLVIANISAACGCTAGEYPRRPIKPGEEEKIEVKFNSSGKQGFQNKTLTVAANTQPSTTTLTITAMVFLPEKD